MKSEYLFIQHMTRTFCLSWKKFKQVFDCQSGLEKCSDVVDMLVNDISRSIAKILEFKKVQRFPRNSFELRFIQKARIPSKESKHCS
ncbi:CLUMA_CG002448, isoform A [Clunio marinus]|uniref:CLUMA_CG002448, isoform A n=1 Tax=Clunio marinus TaxID=568069 RepID=A0A1J1HL17_9DIPT|nr:CLUMA_CG002448, isoform A [Clunio marinus]